MNTNIVLRRQAWVRSHTDKEIHTSLSSDMNNGAVFLIGELTASRIIGRTTFEKVGANAAQDDTPMEMRAIAVEEVENFIVVTRE